MIAQCPSGEDEEGCTIPESARHIMSLFLFIIIVISILNLKSFLKRRNIILAKISAMILT